jgi:hypothetical protein
VLSAFDLIELDGADYGLMRIEECKRAPRKLLRAIGSSRQDHFDEEGAILFPRSLPARL